MFPHATKHPKGVRSSTVALALVLPAIIALLAFLVLPPGHALGKSHAAADQAVPSSTPGTPTPNGSVSRGVGSVSYNNNLYVFVVGRDYRLWVDYWNRSSWQWADQGSPA